MIGGKGYGRTRRPCRLLRWAFGLPVYVYRLQLGWLLGRCFLMVVHRGRKTGRIRRTVLEVVRSDAATGESIVVAAYASMADWYRNLRAHPALEIHIGREHYTPVQRFLTTEEVEAELADYERRRPRLLGVLLRAVRLRYDGTDLQRRAIAAHLRMVAFPRSPGGRGD